MNTQMSPDRSDQEKVLFQSVRDYYSTEESLTYYSDRTRNFSDRAYKSPGRAFGQYATSNRDEAFFGDDFFKLNESTWVVVEVTLNARYTTAKADEVLSVGLRYVPSAARAGRRRRQRNTDPASGEMAAY